MSTKNTKDIVQSKTILVNALVFLLSILAMINPEMLKGLGLPDEFAGKVVTGVASVMSIINIALRFMTSKAISLFWK